MKRVFMIIDDDPDDRFFFVEAVNKISPTHECIQLESGQKALEHLRQNETLPHYIFLDLNMPRMGGKEVLREIKNDERLKATPVIMYSSSTYQPDIDESKQLGAKTYLTKPVTLSILPDEISAAIESD